MKKQSKINSKFVGKPKGGPIKKPIQTKPKQINGNNATDIKEQKWAKLSLDEFINSSASEDNTSSIDEGSTKSDVEASEEIESEVDDETDEENDEIDEEDEGMDEADEDDEEIEEDVEDSEGESGDESDDDTAVKKHKKTLNKLKNTDPEFYQFLSENDRELLEFGSSDSEDDERGGQVHELPKPEELEVGSDESDFEDQESAAKRQKNVITQSMVDKWQQELQDPKYYTC